MNTYWQDPAHLRDATYGCKDKYLHEQEWEEIRKLIWAYLPDDRPFSVLDVGCRRVEDTEAALGPRAIVTGVDADPISDRTMRCTAADLPKVYPSKKFNLVMCKRLLCNLPPDEQRSVVREMRRRTAEGGCTLLCEPDATCHSNVSQARYEAGMPAMCRPSFNHPVDLEGHATVFGRGSVVVRYVAPAYYYWTRFLLPFMLGKEISYEKEYLRRAFPSLGSEQVKLFGVHQIVLSRRQRLNREPCSDLEAQP